MIPILDNTSTSTVCLLPFSVVMRINADKPRGNSDYYFQHITIREGSRRRKTGEGWKEKKGKSERELHEAHNHLLGGDLKNLQAQKSEERKPNVHFSKETAAEFPKF